MNSKILLIMGVSGAGKTTLIHTIKTLDTRFEVIPLYTTRDIRQGETDRISVNNSDFENLAQQKYLIPGRNIYGNLRTGISKVMIENALQQGYFPIFDWPIKNLDILQKNFPHQIYSVYIKPPCLDVLQQRLNDGRDPQKVRLEAAVTELNKLENGDYDHSINYVIVNEQRKADLIAQNIYQSYLTACVEIQN
jgi:guanylate kinase